MSSNDAAANAGPSGLTPEYKAALSQATDMISQGHTQDAAVDHLVPNSMPRLVAKVWSSSWINATRSLHTVSCQAGPRNEEQTWQT